MKLTFKENINKESVVLKHKIALETTTLLNERDEILSTEIELYAMISTVDNFIQENLVEMIGQDERDFTTIVIEEIEPKFMEIIEVYDFKDIYEEIVDAASDFIYNRLYNLNTLTGMINNIVSLIDSRDWSDLKYFFSDVVTKATNLITSDGVKDAVMPPIQQATEEDLSEASEKITALIDKFRKQGAELQNNNVIQEEIKIEENNE